MVVNKIDEKKNLSEKVIINKIYSLTPQIRGLPIFLYQQKKKIGLDSLILGIKNNMISGIKEFQLENLILGYSLW